MTDATDKSRVALFKALHEFQKDCPPISKNSTAGQKFTYSYASLDHIWNTIKEKLTENGLSVSWDACSDLCGDMAGIQCTCIVRHVDGGEVSGRAWVPIDRTAAMNDAQKGGASITYAQRYSLGAALGLASITEDTDAQSGAGAGQSKRAPRPGPTTQRPPAASQPAGENRQKFTGRVTRVAQKSGEGKKGPWTRYGILTDASELWLNTFSDSHGAAAQAAKDSGDLVEVWFEETEYQGRPQYNLTDIAPAATDGEEPPF